MKNETAPQSPAAPTPFGEALIALANQIESADKDRRAAWAAHGLDSTESRAAQEILCSRHDALHALIAAQAVS